MCSSPMEPALGASINDPWLDSQAVAMIGVSLRRLFIAAECRPDKVQRAMDLIDQIGVRPELLTLTTKVFDHV
jgi:hypothetical protein